MSDFYTYPSKLTKDHIFYIEYHKFPHELNYFWQLFQRQFIEDEEVHPYNLAEGECNFDISINNPKYLEFMVEAMNEKIVRDKNYENQTKMA